jgi:lipopolysaccharide/colanic/teichoic acid biosynthesis glycosyltransferase
MIVLCSCLLPMPTNFYVQRGKRWLDAACAAGGLILLSPLLCAAALAVKLNSRGPVFFRQSRVGQFGRTFRIFKFRTMIQDAARRGPLLTADGDPRITRLGKLLRKTKIDELPQLLNVLVGDMSLVGPRPEVPKFVETYTEKQKPVLRVKPGVTGPSIIIDEEERLGVQADKEKYYVETILPEKIRVDLTYTENIRFWVDVRLIANTFPLIAGRIFSSHRPRVQVAQRQS